MMLFLMTSEIFGQTTYSVTNLLISDCTYQVNCVATYTKNSPGPNYCILFAYKTIAPDQTASFTVPLKAGYTFSGVKFSAKTGTYTFSNFYMNIMGDDTRDGNCSPYPGNSTVWQSFSTTEATIFAGLITGEEKMQVSDSTDESTLDNKLTELSIVTSVDQFSNDQQILYPNPAENEIFFEANEAGVLYLYNLSGQVMMESDYCQGSNQFDISELPSGQFIVVLNSTTNTSTYQITKQ